MRTNGPLTGKGFYLVERGFMDLEIFKKEPYTEREAFLYLIEDAAYEPRIRNIDGMVIDTNVGELIASYRFLAEAWNWKSKQQKLAKDKVSRFLSKLERNGYIDIDTNYHVERDSYTTESVKHYNKRPALIRVNDYSKLQRRGEYSSTRSKDSSTEKNETALRQQDDKPNQYQTSSNNKKNKQLVGASQENTYLFEKFPKCENTEEFYLYMPFVWKDYALTEKNWSDDHLLMQIRLFWTNYAGRDLVERQTKYSSFDKRTHWDAVWRSWCDRNFRN